MQMIDIDIFWYGETFRAILMELRKIRNGETVTKTCKELKKGSLQISHDVLGKPG